MLTIASRTVEEVDKHLYFIVSLLQYGRSSSRDSTMRRADKLLDERLYLTDGIYPDDAAPFKDNEIEAPVYVNEDDGA